MTRANAAQKISKSAEPGSRAKSWEIVASRILCGGGGNFHLARDVTLNDKSMSNPLSACWATWGSRQTASAANGGDDQRIGPDLPQGQGSPGVTQPSASQCDALQKRRAWDSNPQPLAGHLNSNQAASQFAYPPRRLDVRFMILPEQATFEGAEWFSLCRTDEA